MNFVLGLHLNVMLAYTILGFDASIFKIWNGHSLNNTIQIGTEEPSRNQLHCAFKCLHIKTCMASSFNLSSMSCGLHRTMDGNNSIIVTEEADEHYLLFVPVAHSNGISPSGFNQSQCIKVIKYGDMNISNTETAQTKNWTILGAVDCYQNKSMDYNGTINYTVCGRTCQAWNVNSPHTVYYQPINTTARNTNYCRESLHYEGGPVCYTSDPSMEWEYCYIVKCDACGVNERLPVVPAVATSHFHVGKFIGMVFTCISLSSGSSTAHCPVSQCGANDQWSTNYSMSCTVEDCYTVSSTYKGKVTCTSGGIPCQVWNSAGGVKPAAPDSSTNYCRDPDNTGKPWCYTTDPNVRWDYCPVPKC